MSIKQNLHLKLLPIRIKNISFIECTIIEKNDALFSVSIIEAMWKISEYIRFYINFTLPICSRDKILSECNFNLYFAVLVLFLEGAASHSLSNRVNRISDGSLLMLQIPDIYTKLIDSWQLFLFCLGII